MQHVPSSIETREIGEAELDGVAGGLNIGNIGGLNLAPATGLDLGGVDLGGVAAGVSAPLQTSLGGVAAGL
ncbi:hypothetical protein [Streptomyces sp. NPDC048410]|uniref:hypothetical protein n=1 Tax=Streptomyces sp. NPDC048410 TaxID=3365545 RepID=UPI003713835A